AFLPLLLLNNLLYRVRSRITIAEFYFLVVLGLVSVHRLRNGRYLLPLLPIYLVYILEDFRALLVYVPPGIAPALNAIATLLWVSPAAANITTLYSPDVDTLVTTPLYEQMRQVLRDKTAPKQLVVSWNTRVMALSIGRQISGYPHVAVDPLLAFLQRI